jgi:hypothetical protein
MSIGRCLRRGLLCTLALFLGTAGSVSARPCESQSDRAAVTAATAAAQAECNCSTAASHKDFVICAERVTKTRKAGGMLPAQCVNEANRCAKRSTCGRPGAVTCCRTNQQGRTKCFIKRSAGECIAPPNGTATMGGCASCCQSCGEGTCEATIRCCVHRSTGGAFTEATDGLLQCQETTPATCASEGGIDLGPGTCDATTCASTSTTTTTTTTTTTQPTTTTTTTHPPTTTTTTTTSTTTTIPTTTTTTTTTQPPTTTTTHPTTTTTTTAASTTTMTAASTTTVTEPSTTTTTTPSTTTTSMIVVTSTTTTASTTTSPTTTGMSSTTTSTTTPDNSTTTTTTPVSCGNGTIDSGEECDGTDFGGATCPAGSPLGALLCTPDCKIDHSNCHSPTITTLPLRVKEICGNCIDDDGDGLTDFEDPDCCAQGQLFDMLKVHSKMKPRGENTNFQIQSTLAQVGLGNQVNPHQKGQDVFVQIRPVGGKDIFCAWVPAKKFMTMHNSYMFWDRHLRVKSAKGLSDMTLIVGNNGRLRFRTHGGRTQLKTPGESSLQVTVAFHNPAAGDTSNRCSTTLVLFHTNPSGGLRTP